MASPKVMTSSKSRNSDLSSSTTTPTASRSRRASSGVTVASSSSFTTTTTIAATNTGTPQQQQQATSTSFSDHAASATMTVDGLLRDVYGTPSAESTLLDAQITLIDPPNLLPTPETDQEMSDAVAAPAGKTVDDVWREIVAGRREMKEEQADEMMTLEDFLVKAGAAVPEIEEVGDVKMEAVTTDRLSGGVYAFDPVVSSTPPNAFQVLDKMEGSIVGFGSNGMDHMVGVGGGGRGKRGRSTSLIEPLDKAAQQRQRRMIKNRESAARSRERKQAYQVELESLAMRLEEENERLLKEKEERTKERFKQLMEKVIPVVEKRRPPRALRRVRSFEW